MPPSKKKRPKNSSKLFDPMLSGAAYKARVNKTGLDPEAFAARIGVSKTTIYLRFKREQVELESFLALDALNLAPLDDTNRAMIVSESRIKGIKPPSKGKPSHYDVVKALRGASGVEPSKFTHAIEQTAKLYFGVVEITESTKMLVMNDYTGRTSLTVYVYTVFPGPIGGIKNPNALPIFMKAYKRDGRKKLPVTLDEFFEQVWEMHSEDEVNKWKSALLATYFPSKEAASHALIKSVEDEILPAQKLSRALEHFKGPAVWGSVQEPDREISLMRLIHPLSQAIGFRANTKSGLRIQVQRHAKLAEFAADHLTKFGGLSIRPETDTQI